MILDAAEKVAGSVFWGIEHLLIFAGKYITKYVYPLIPKLYNMFEYLSTFKFLDDSFIHNVWNNIYMLVAVMVLFAIAIKLIATMVNPDTMNDNKNGLKFYYFRAVAAVISIFLIPLLFEYSFDLQSRLIGGNYIVTRVFGYELKEDEKIGQVLAWQAFSAFCTVGKNYPDVQLTSAYYNTKVDISKVGDLLALLEETRKTPTMDTLSSTIDMEDAVLKTLNPEYRLDASYEYHPILVPATGLFVAYELVLLCMDTLFRAVKLSILELMLPIILGAFVFKPDILKKWVKEFFSTYITLFFKALGMGMLLIALSEVPVLMNTRKDFFADTVTDGLFRAFFIIAILQIIKKIPELINTIFGTNIKEAGGIKGRLGQMAGIGGLASSAWSSLGNKLATTAKNVGKLSATLPIAGAAFLGYKGIDAIYHQKTGGRLKNTAAFRQGKGAFFFGQSALKTGSWAEGVKAYDQSIAMQKLSQSDLQDVGENTRNKIRNGQEGWRKNIYTGKKANGEWLSEEEHMKNLNQTAAGTKHIKGHNRELAENAVNDKKKAIARQSKIDKIESNMSELSSHLDGYLSVAQSREQRGATGLISRVQDIQNRFSENKSMEEDDRKFLLDNGIATAAQLKTDNKIYDKMYKTMNELTDELKADAKTDEEKNNVNLHSKAGFGSAKSDNKSLLDSANSDIQAYYNDAKVSDENKQKLRVIDSDMEQIGAKIGPSSQNLPQAQSDAIDVKIDEWDAEARAVQAEAARQAEEQARLQAEAEEQARLKAEAEEQARQQAEAARIQSIQDLIDRAQAELDAILEEEKNVHRHGTATQIRDVESRRAAKEAEIANLKSQL